MEKVFILHLKNVKLVMNCLKNGKKTTAKVALHRETMIIISVFGR